MSIFVYDITVLLVDSLNLLFYFFMFKMKIVEMEVDEKAVNSHEIIANIRQVHKRAKITLIFYVVILIVFTVFHMAYKIFEVFNGTISSDTISDEIAAILNAFFFVPFDILKMYLAYYFWKLSLNFV